MNVPWAVESPLGGGDGPSVGCGSVKDYGASFGEQYKSPRGFLLKKKQEEWSEGKKSPETTVPVPTAYPEKQVKRDRSSFLLGQDSPIDPLDLEGRSSRRKVASDVQLVLLEQIAERIRKRKERRAEQASAQDIAKPEVQAEVKGKVEVKCELGGGPELDLIVVNPLPKGNVQLDKNGIAAKQLRKMKEAKELKQKKESVKERENKARAELLERKQKKESEKEAAKRFTEKFVSKGLMIMEEAQRVAQASGIATGLKMAGQKPVAMAKKAPIINVKSKGKCGMKPEAPPRSVAMEKVLQNNVKESEKRKFLDLNGNEDEDHGGSPSKIPILKIELRPANYNLPRVNRVPCFRYKQVKLEVTMKEELSNEPKVAGVIGGNSGDGVDLPSGADNAAAASGSSTNPPKKSRIPILAQEKRSSDYSPPRKVFKTGLSYVPRYGAQQKREKEE